MADSRVSAAMKRLAVARERRRRGALGPPLQIDDAHLDALAVVGPQDIPAVEAMVRDAAGETGVAMLRATRDG